MMRTIETNDDSFTLFSEKYEEAYHSRSGAIKESFNKYFMPCEIADLALSGEMSILDVGFGLGYNALSVIYGVRQINCNCKVTIISLEKDLIPDNTLQQIYIPHKYENDYKILLRSVKEGSYCSDNLTIKILCGDARSEILEIEDSFDAVFLDPFSPKKNPQLWTVDFFKELYKRMNREALLSTYSASTPVRSGLMEAGFFIGEGPGDEIKRGGTVASKAQKKVYMPDEVFKKIKKSPERTPFYDPQLKFTDQEIFGYREDIKRNIRGKP